MSLIPRPRRLLALAVIAALVLSACGGDATPAASGGNDSTDSTDQEDSGTPQIGGTLTFLEYQAPTCLYAGGGGFYPNATLINQIGDKLTYQNPETREITPWLASSWEINDDATEYVFHLRDDVTFSNGTPLDAEAVALNFDHFGLGDEEIGLAAQEFVVNYTGSEVIDEHTVRFTFSQPSPGFLQATSVVGASIVAPELASLPYEEQCQPENYIGSGPFTITDVVPEQEYTLTVREDYAWGPEALEHTDRAYLDEIKVIVTPEDSVRIGAVTSGEADILRTIQAYDEAAFTSQGFKIYAPATNGVNPSLALRFQNPAVSDINVRKALLHGTDIDLVVETLYSDLYPRATSVLSTGATGYIDLSDELYYDQEEALELLDDAGWVPGSDGIRSKDGVRLELTTFVTSVFPQSQQNLEIIAQQWEELGVKLNIELPDPATQTERQRDYNDIGVNGTHVGRVDPEVLTSNFHSASRRNSLLSNDDDLDALLERISATAVEEERYDVAAEVQQYLIEQAYVIPMFELPQTYGAAAYVKGVYWEPVGRVHLYNTWLDR